jgi:NodT family efflux transporter outer membrane factor (OMF) lipoprotein
LQALIDTAILNNPDLQIALQKLAMLRANKLLIDGTTRLSVDAVLSGGIEKYGDYTMNGVGNYDMNLSPNVSKDQQVPTPVPDMYLGLRSSWEADIWGKLSEKKKAAYLRYLASEKGRQWAITQLVAEVASLYYELLALDKEQEIIVNNIVLQESQLEIVKAQKEGGRATELAVQQFNAQLLSTKSKRFVIKQEIVQTENSLKALSGKFMLNLTRSSSINDLALPQSISAGVPSRLLLQRPDLQEMELNLKANGADVEATRKAFLPSLNISAYVALNSFNPAYWINPASLAYGLAGGLMAPLLNKNQLKANHAMATAAQMEAFQQYRKTVINAYQEVLTPLSGIAHYKEVYTLKQAETVSLQKAVITAKELYLTGYASYLEVVTAQRGVLDAELESISNKKITFIYLINLYRALGGGWQ